MMKLRCGSEPAACWLSSCCCRRLASARVAYVPLSSSPSYTLYGARGSSSWAMLRLRGKFILERDSLKFFAEVSDPIFALLALQCWHEPCYRISAACRAEHAVLGMVVDGLSDLEFRQHLTGHRGPQFRERARLSAGAREVAVSARTL